MANKDDIKFEIAKLHVSEAIKKECSMNKTYK